MGVSDNEIKILADLIKGVRVEISEMRDDVREDLRQLRDEVRQNHADHEERIRKLEASDTARASAPIAIRKNGSRREWLTAVVAFATALVALARSWWTGR